MLKLIPDMDDENRIELINRVFEIKLLQPMHDIKKEQIVGKTVASKYNPKLYLQNNNLYY